MPGSPTEPAKIVRTERVKQPREYMQRAANGEAVFERRIVTRNDVGFEFMLNALRLTDGFLVREFEERTGFSITTVSKSLDQCERQGFIERDHIRIRTTPLGRRFLNQVMLEFLQ
jgi:coproporphyrinogen III oxidase-like Fe-S oxidoreductase